MGVFADCIKRVEEAASLVKVDQKLIDEICHGGDVVELKFPAMTLSGKKYFEGVRVHQINPHELGQPHPFKGGWRYKNYPSKEEMIDVTKALALDMLDKIVLTNLPFAGAKGCLNIDTSQFTTDELWSITNALTIEMITKNLLDANIDVPGPDYGTNAETMKWIYRLFGKLNQCLHWANSAAVVTGKPVDFDGCPGREDATARGGLIVYGELVKNKKIPRVAVQGFGNVGYNACKLLSEDNFDDASGRLVAITDINSGVYNAGGISFNALKEYYLQNKTFKGSKLGDEIAPDNIESAGEYDLFISAATESITTKQKAEILKTKTYLELGNSAITHEADKILQDRGILVIPDIVANGGGVVVSSFEWRKNRGDILHEVDLDETAQWVYSELRKVMKSCIKKVTEVKQKHKHISWRTAAKIRSLTDMEAMLKRKNA